MKKKLLLTMFLVYLLIACTPYFTSTVSSSASEFVFGPSDERVVSNPIWSPLGRELAFTVFDPWSGDNAIYILNLDTTDARVLIDENGVESLSWSPDGKHIAYNQYRDIWLLQSEDDSSPEFLAEGQVAAWSSNGRQIAIFEKVDPDSLGNYDLKILDLESRIETIVLSVDTGKLEIFDLTWSPVNEQLAFSLPPNEIETRTIGQQIYILDLVTEKLTQFTFSGENYLPVWSPNGKLIAYIHRASSAAPSSIMISQADGSCKVIVPGIYDVGGLAWSPEGSDLAYTEPRGVYLLDLALVFGEDFSIAGPKCH